MDDPKPEPSDDFPLGLEEDPQVDLSQKYKRQKPQEVNIDLTYDPQVN